MDFIKGALILVLLGFLSEAIDVVTDGRGGLLDFAISLVIMGTLIMFFIRFCIFLGSLI